MKGNQVHREPLTSDIIFKAVFGQDTADSKAALIAMLNIILERNDDPIVDLVHLNPFSIAEAINEKVIIMDIKVKTSSNVFIDIEMQVGNLDTYVLRTIFYGCKQLTKGLERGEDYVKMKKSIVISFIKTTLFSHTTPAHSVFTLTERTTKEELSKILELHYIELGKIQLCSSPEQLSPLEQLCTYIKCAGDPNSGDFVETLVQRGRKEISMIDKVLKKVSEEERLQAIRESREMAEIQILMEKTYSRELGIEEGREEGIIQTARKMKAEGIAFEIIAKCCDLSVDKIKEL